MALFLQGGDGEVLHGGVEGMVLFVGVDDEDLHGFSNAKSMAWVRRRDTPLNAGEKP
jgi:hypothetical protein